MGRYCIICNRMFGCVQDKVKQVCDGCGLMDSCCLLDQFSMSQITGGICDCCWEKHQAFKTAKG